MRRRRIAGTLRPSGRVKLYGTVYAVEYDFPQGCYLVVVGVKN
jgi:hypothetical protein